MSQTHARPKFVILMSGLPGMGKSHFSKKITEHFSALGYKIATFNAGNYRRALLGAEAPADFFNPSIDTYVHLREEIASKCLEDLLAWMQTGDLAILDATNSSPQRRQYLRERLAQKGLDYIFVEFICTNRGLLERLMDAKIKNGQDFKGKPRTQARQELAERLSNYARAYQKIDAGEENVITVYNLGERITNSCSSQKKFDDLYDLLEQQSSKSKACLMDE